MDQRHPSQRKTLGSLLELHWATTTRDPSDMREPNSLVIDENRLMLMVEEAIEQASARKQGEALHGGQREHQADDSIDSELGERHHTRPTERLRLVEVPPRRPVSMKVRKHSMRPMKNSIPMRFDSAPPETPSQRLRVAVEGEAPGISMCPEGLNIPGKNAPVSTQVPRLHARTLFPHRERPDLETQLPRSAGFDTLVPKTAEIEGPTRRAINEHSLGASQSCEALRGPQDSCFTGSSGWGPARLSLHPDEVRRRSVQVVACTTEKESGIAGDRWSQQCFTGAAQRVASSERLPRHRLKLDCAATRMAERESTRLDAGAHTPIPVQIPEPTRVEELEDVRLFHADVLLYVDEEYPSDRDLNPIDEDNCPSKCRSPFDDSSMLEMQHYTVDDDAPNHAIQRQKRRTKRPRTGPDSRRSPSKPRRRSRYAKNLPAYHAQLKHLSAISERSSTSGNAPLPWESQDLPPSPLRRPPTIALPAPPIEICWRPRLYLQGPIRLTVQAKCERTDSVTECSQKSGYVFRQLDTQEVAQDVDDIRVADDICDFFDEYRFDSVSFAGDIFVNHPPNPLQGQDNVAQMSLIPGVLAHKNSSVSDVTLFSESPFVAQAASRSRFASKIAAKYTIAQGILATETRPYLSSSSTRLADSVSSLHHHQLRSTMSLQSFASIRPPRSADALKVKLDSARIESFILGTQPGPPPTSTSDAPYLAADDDLDRSMRQEIDDILFDWGDEGDERRSEELVAQEIEPNRPWHVSAGPLPKRHLAAAKRVPRWPHATGRTNPLVKIRKLVTTASGVI